MHETNDVQDHFGTFSEIQVEEAARHLERKEPGQEHITLSI